MGHASPLADAPEAVLPGTPRASRVGRAFAVVGIVGPLFYIVRVVVLGLLWSGYDPIRQTQSELGADVAATMIVQGKRDDATPWRQATRLTDALRDAGVEVELILDPEMGHESDPKYLEPITRFLDDHLGAP